MQTETLDSSLNLIRLQHPRVFNLIKSTWGTMELQLWLSKALIDPGELELQLSTEAAVALMTISLEHAEKFKFKMVGEVVRKCF